VVGVVVHLLHLMVEVEAEATQEEVVVPLKTLVPLVVEGVVVPITAVAINPTQEAIIQAMAV